MKSLSESLFDSDLIKKPLMKNNELFTFEGALIYKTISMWRGDIKMYEKFQAHIHNKFGDKFDKNFLDAIDWKFFQKEYKKSGADKIDLRNYSYYSTDVLDRTKPALEKSEKFARYVLNLDLGMLWNHESFNSRFRDDLLTEVNRFIDDPDDFEFDYYSLAKDSFFIRLRYKGFSSANYDMIVCQWEFEER